MVTANLPRPESDHETEPGEEEYAAMYADHIEQRYRASFAIEGVDFRTLPEHLRFEANHAVGSFFSCGSAGFLGR